MNEHIIKTSKTLRVFGANDLLEGDTLVFGKRTYTYKGVDAVDARPYEFLLEGTANGTRHFTGEEVRDFIRAGMISRPRQTTVYDQIALQ